MRRRLVRFAVVLVFIGIGAGGVWQDVGVGWNGGVSLARAAVNGSSVPIQRAFRPVYRSGDIAISPDAVTPPPPVPPQDPNTTLILVLSDSGPGVSANSTLHYIPSAPMSGGETLTLTFPASFSIPAAFGVEDADLLVDGTHLALSQYPGVVASGIVVGPSDITITLGTTVSIPRSATVAIWLGTHAEANGRGTNAIRTPLTAGTVDVTFTHRTAAGSTVRTALIAVTILPHVALSAFTPTLLKNDRDEVVIPTGVALESVAATQDALFDMTDNPNAFRFGTAIAAGSIGGVVSADLLVRQYAAKEVVITSVAPSPIAARVVGASVYDVLLIANAQYLSTLHAPMTLTFPYDATDIVGPQEEVTLHVRSFDPLSRTWIPLPASAVNRVTRRVTTTTDHLSLFGLFTERLTVGGFAGPTVPPEELYVLGCRRGDINCDSAINLLDLLIARERWLTGVYDERADLNRDGSVNLRDISMLLARWT